MGNYLSSSSDSGPGFSSRELRPTTPPITRPTTPPKTLMDTPWRKVEGITEELEKSLKAQIHEYDTGHPKIKNARILLLGPVGAGKSSLINTIASVDSDRISEAVMAGDDLTSLSKQLIVYRPSGELRGFRIIDTMGVEEAKGMGFHVADATAIIEGKVKPNYKFNPLSPVSENDAAYITKPKLKDTASCVVFVLDARNAFHGSISDKTQAKIDILQEAIKQRNLKRILILTHIDRLCPEVSKDLSNVFRSVKVKEAVLAGSKIFGLPEMNIFPVENYHAQLEVDPLRNILTLLALRQAMHFSSDYLKLKAEWNADIVVLRRTNRSYI